MEADYRARDPQKFVGVLQQTSNTCRTPTWLSACALKVKFISLVDVSSIR